MNPAVMHRQISTDPLFQAALARAYELVCGETFPALDRGGARPILLKGVSLARRLYDESEGRVSDDLDVLVDPAEEDAAILALRQLGYSRPPGHHARDLSGGQVWTRGSGAPCVDLHTRLGWVGTPPATAFEVLRSYTVPLATGNLTVRAFNDVALALHVAIHAALDGGAGEKSMEDLRRACVAFGDDVWLQARDLALRLQAAEGMWAGLALLPEGRAIAVRTGLPRNRSLAVEMGIAGSGQGVLVLTSASGWRARLEAVLALLFPGPVRQRRRWEFARRGRVGLFASYVVWPAYLVYSVPRLVLRTGRAYLRGQERTRS